MPIEILMPALSPTMTEGNLAKWLKKEGDKVAPGDIIAEIETDKATMEVEAVEEGVLARIIIPEGSQNIPVNSIIAILAEEGEEITELDIIQTPSPAAEILHETIKPDAHFDHEIHVRLDTGKSVPHQEESRIFASPLAKRLAELEGVELNHVQGSGPRGRIVKTDIINAKHLLAQRQEITSKVQEIKNDRASEDYRLVPNNNIRKIIARRLVESKQTIPHFYLNIECNIDKLLEMRQEINQSLVEIGQRISVNDFIILAAAKALREVPEANSSWGEDAIIYYNNIDISVAVAISSGLITPIIKNADKQSITCISKTMKDLAARAREGKLKPEEFQGGNFSISNLGMYGIKNFNAIINPPQSCILAIGASAKRPVIINDQLGSATIMDCTLSCDHRVVDGAVGANFLKAFKKFIESPLLLLV